MVHFKGFIGVARGSYPLISGVKQSPSLENHGIPVRTFINGFFKKSEKSIEELKERELKPLTGIDDPNFSKNLKNVIYQLDVKKTLTNFGGECKELYREIQGWSKSVHNRLDNKNRRCDMLYTFETEEDIKKFSVYTDSSNDEGYSTASLILTPRETALFSGNICNEVPKDGNVKTAGYANFSNNVVLKAFFRETIMDFSPYTHMVLKIRGDGRTYLVVLNLHSKYVETKYLGYAHPLFTRGGPYWQIAKIPLSHFFRINSGRVQMNQNMYQDLKNIRKIGITATAHEGPFHLEIDYIGLEFVDTHNNICPYESYRMPYF